MTGNSIKKPSIPSFARKAGRMTLIMLSILLACIPMLVGILLLLSRGKPKPFVDENGRPLADSISEKVFVNINGVEQGMFIESKDDKHPVLLYLPVYFFHGIYDYTCSYTEAKSYFEKLKAPVKGFYTFEQSAHSPMFEEPEKTLIILQEDVLIGANGLAEAK